jgi:hypothetical protein
LSVWVRIDFILALVITSDILIIKIAPKHIITTTENIPPKILSYAGYPRTRKTGPANNKSHLLIVYLKPF